MREGGWPKRPRADSALSASSDRRRAARSAVASLLALLSIPGCVGEPRNRPGGVSAIVRASLLPDVSGLAWIDGDRFLAVHDAKVPEEADLPRLSVLELPEGLDGVRWTVQPVSWPGETASDLESIARIPGVSGRFLVAESTEEVAAKPWSNRIFLIEVTGAGTRVVDAVAWPVPTVNVEGIAVAAAGDRRVFLFAERGHGEPAVEIRWAELSLEPLGFGAFQSAGRFRPRDPTGAAARPVSALEVDARGFLYAASAEDPDDDAGPFRSAVYRVGRVSMDPREPRVELFREPQHVGGLDGLKIEAVAAREREDGSVELWIGVDDEFYGGTIRPLPVRRGEP